MLESHEREKQKLKDLWEEVKRKKQVQLELHSQTINHLQEIWKMNEIIHEQKLKISEDNQRGPDQPEIDLDLNKLNEDY